MRQLLLVATSAMFVLGGFMLYETRPARAEDSKPTSAQAEPARQQTEEERAPLRMYPPSWEPDQDSENWTRLSPELGIWLYQDQFGSPRGRIYVQREDRWVAVAIDGLSDIADPTLPAR